FNRQGVDYTFDGQRTGGGTTGVHFGDYQPPSTQGENTVGGQWTYDAVSDPALAWGSDGTMYYGMLGFDVLNDGYAGFWVRRSDAGNKGTFLHSPDSADLGTLDQYADSPVGLIHDNFSNTNLSDDKEFIA